MSKDGMSLPIKYSKLSLVVYFYNLLKPHIKGNKGIKKESTHSDKENRVGNNRS